MADEQAVHIRVTGKQLGVVVTAVIALLSSYPLANWISPDVRSDPFTGADGTELEDRIEIIELEIAGCQRDNSAHREVQAGELATIKAKTFSNEYLIKQCIRITGQ